MKYCCGTPNDAPLRAQCGEPCETFPDETSTDAAILPIRMNRKWRQAMPSLRSAIDQHRREGDVADDRAAVLCDKSQRQSSGPTQGVNDQVFCRDVVRRSMRVGSAKGRFDHGAYRVEILRALFSDDHGHFCRQKNRLAASCRLRGHASAPGWSAAAEVLDRQQVSLVLATEQAFNGCASRSRGSSCDLLAARIGARWRLE